MQPQPIWKCKKVDNSFQQPEEPKESVQPDWVDHGSEDGEESEPECDDAVEVLPPCDASCAEVKDPEQTDRLWKDKASSLGLSASSSQFAKLQSWNAKEINNLFGQTPAQMLKYMLTVPTGQL